MLLSGCGHPMRRREFISLVSGAAAWPLAARAQQTSDIPRFGFVYQGSQAAMALRIEAIRPTGFRLRRSHPSRDYGPSGPLVLNAARSATRSIPVVAIDFETDPIASGVAATLCATRGQHHWRIP